jgi:hypothetical protein
MANAALIVTAVNAHEKMQAALEEIAHESSLPLRGNQWIVEQDIVGIACEALGLCRECRSPLVPEKSACDVCGAARAAPGEE